MIRQFPEPTNLSLVASILTFVETLARNLQPEPLHMALLAATHATMRGCRRGTAVALRQRTNFHPVRPEHVGMFGDFPLTPESPTQTAPTAPSGWESAA